jgi:hypothetical protein
MAVCVQDFCDRNLALKKREDELQQNIDEMENKKAELQKTTTELKQHIAELQENNIENTINTLTQLGNRVLLCYGAGGLIFLLGGGIGEVLGLGKTASQLGLCPK